MFHPDAASVELKGHEEKTSSRKAATSAEVAVIDVVGDLVEVVAAPPELPYRQHRGAWHAVFMDASMTESSG
jgi:hypothetical protein